MRELNVRDFGARGDGRTDDSRSIQAAITAAGRSPGTTLHFPYTSHGYLASRLVVTDSDLLIRFHDGVRLTAPPRRRGDLLTVRGERGRPIRLRTEPSTGDRVIDVAESGLIAAGDRVEIAAQSPMEPAMRALELLEVSAVENGRVRLNAPIRALIDGVDRSVLVHVIRPVARVRIIGGQFTAPVGSADGIRCEHCVDVHLEDLAVSSFTHFGVVLDRCASASLTGISASGGGDPRRSWAITLQSCSDVELVDCLVRNQPWDGFNLTFGSMHNVLRRCRTISVGDVGFVIGHGVRGHHNRLDDCVAVDSAGAGFALGNPSYMGDDDNTLARCEAWYCGNGFVVRRDSRRNEIGDCLAFGCFGSGFYTESMSSGTVLERCRGFSNDVAGAILEGPTHVRGGAYRDNTGNGIRVQGAPGSHITGPLVIRSGGSNIAVVRHADRCTIEDVVVEDSRDGSGIVVSDSRHVSVARVTARRNARYGVEVIETEPAASEGTRVLDGTFAGNRLGDVNPPLIRGR